MVKGEPTYHDPPERILRLLRWFCADDFLEEIEGDLYELYQEEVAEYGLPRARRRFFFLSMRYIRPYFFGKKDFSFHFIHRIDMIRHYLKVSFRHLLRQKFFSFINILGLATGLACCLLIALFIQHEISYDRHYEKGEQLYRVAYDYSMRGNAGSGAVVPTPVASTLLEEVPGVRMTARIAPSMSDAGNNQFRRADQEQNTYEEGFVYADTAFMEMFDFPMIQGDVKTALDEPNTIVLTERKARQYFSPGENPIGQIFFLNNNKDNPYKVSGVMKDLPDNTHLRFDFLLSMQGLEESKIPNWNFYNFVSYALLEGQAELTTVNATLNKVLNAYVNPESEKQAALGNYMRFYFQPLADIHLHSAHIREYWSHGDVRYVWFFGLIAAFILLIACINFMNLSTARSANRAKEVGLRKVFGSMRQQLAGRFLTESVLLSVLAFMLSIFMVRLALPYFNLLSGKSLQLPWQEPLIIGAAFLGVIGVGLLAGAYPSTFLSAFKPIQVLKGKLRIGSRSGRLRSSLVVFQFTLSIALIISSLVVYQQLNYIQNKKLGFDKEQLLIVEDSHTLGASMASFKETLKQLPEVEQVSVSSYLPVGGYMRNNSSAWTGAVETKENSVGLAKWYVDFDYLETLGMEIIEGRGFSSEFPTDSQAIVLNEQAVKMLKLEDPIGKKVSSYTYLDAKTGKVLYDTYTVIGVVRDFHYESMKVNIEGLSLVIGNSMVSTAVRLRPGALAASVEKVKSVWEQFAPNQSFRYHFMDEQYTAMYEQEEWIGSIFAIFTGLAIFIACLGLFALAAFMAEQRQKEISIRKVLGASTSSILILLTKNFLLLVVLAIFLAVPLAWYFMSAWLADFAYQIELSWLIFVLSGLLALVISVLTISYQAFKVAFTDPAEKLRTE
ncbi:MAG: ABC transporter permease [Bacteroidota bacterium]